MGRGLTDDVAEFVHEYLARDRLFGQIFADAVDLTYEVHR